jgi:hypothetical protein
LALSPSNPPPSSDYVWDDPGVPGDPSKPGSYWDVARWNQEFQRYRNWLSLEGMGYAAATHILVSQNVETTLVSFDYVYEVGATV